MLQLLNFKQIKKEKKTKFLRMCIKNFYFKEKIKIHTSILKILALQCQCLTFNYVLYFQKFI